jgi:hypothetical protein
MTGRHHERVPGADRLPLIDVQDGVCGSVLIVRNFDGLEVFRSRYGSRGKAVAAEVQLRADLAHAPRGDYKSVFRRWIETSDEFPPWWVT